MWTLLDKTGSPGQGTRLARLQAYGLFSVVFLATLASIFFADRQHGLYQEENARSMVTEQLSVMRSEMEGRINGNIFLVKGLVAMLEADPAMNPDRFQHLAHRALGQDGNVTVVSAAPDLVVSMVYPPSQSARVGFDFRKRNREHGAAFLAAQSRKVNVSGPVDMDDGRKGLVVNYPVLVEKPGARAELWGLVSATIDLNALFTESGLLAEDMALDVAIARSDVHGVMSAPFFGAPATFGEDPVRMTVTIGQEYWILAAAPQDGWQIATLPLLKFRFLLVFVAAAILIPVIWAIQMMGERHKALQETQRNEIRLETLSKRLEIALDTSRVGIWEHDIANDRQIWDERVLAHFGITEQKPYYSFQEWERLVHPDDLAEATAGYEQAMLLRQPYRGQYRIISRDDGTIRHIRAFGRLVDERPGRERMLGVDWDVTADVLREEALKSARRIAEEQNIELEQARQQMEHNALHDALTGLPNRRYLDQLLGKKAQDPAGAPLTVLHLDLDRFKDINDTLGHAAGDNILRHASRMLRENTEDGDFVARIGGDEFVIVREGAASESCEMDAFAARIIDALSEPVVFEGHECRAGASIGVANQSGRRESTEQLLVNADIALYEAKKRGRGRAVFFNDTLRAQVIHAKQMADEVLRALEHSEFVAYYQPQFDAHTLEIDGVEALVRWNHPERGLVPPDAFLKIAENLNVMHRVDEIVLDHALLHFHQWQAAGLSIPRVSVNISAQRLLDGRLVQKVSGLGIAPGQVCFELLESISFEDQDDTLVHIIAELKQLGIDIEIDDFGTGHASIVNLLKLTPRRLKIDRQLIKPILSSPTERQLVASIIDIGRTCGIAIVAEGVETMEHASVLRDMGCHTLQGYAFAKPMPARDIPGFVLARAWMPATAKKMPPRRRA